MAVTCNDCGKKARHFSDTGLKRGSSVREPGEALCEGCSSRRCLMVRQLDALPDNLPAIRAQRMAPIGTGKGSAA